MIENLELLNRLLAIADFNIKIIDYILLKKQIIISILSVISKTVQLKVSGWIYFGKISEFIANILVKSSLTELGNVLFHANGQINPSEKLGECSLKFY